MWGVGHVIAWSLYNSIPQTGSLKEQTFTSHCSGRWKSKIRMSADLVPGRALLLAKAPFLLCPHVADRGNKAWSLFLFLQGR